MTVKSTSKTTLSLLACNERRGESERRQRVLYYTSHYIKEPA